MISIPNAPWAVPAPAGSPQRHGRRSEPLLARLDLFPALPIHDGPAVPTRRDAAPPPGDSAPEEGRPVPRRTPPNPMTREWRLHAAAKAEKRTAAPAGKTGSPTGRTAT